MEKIDYQEQAEKLKEFQKRIISIKDFEDKIKDSYRIDFRGVWYNKLPVFGFETTTLVPRCIRELCYDIFHEYFPNCETSSL
jgi:hypothetical protein